MTLKALQKIRDRLRAACERAGRDPDEVTLVAVAKGQPIEKVQEAVQGDLRNIGENYAQEMLSHQKALSIPPSPPFKLRGGWGEIHWHFIGHLQTNKVRHVIDAAFLIHCVDSARLAEEIDKRAAAIGKLQSILIEVNLGEEPSKTGVSPKKAGELVTMIQDLDHLSLKGLMAIPPERPQPEEMRPFFRHLRNLRDEINLRGLSQEPLRDLSMGMTHDFEIAIEEGATIVRIGTAIFGPRTDAQEI